MLAVTKVPNSMISHLLSQKTLTQTSVGALPLTANMPFISSKVPTDFFPAQTVRFDTVWIAEYYIMMECHVVNSKPV